MNRLRSEVIERPRSGRSKNSSDRVHNCAEGWFEVGEGGAEGRWVAGLGVAADVRRGCLPESVGAGAWGGGQHGGGEFGVEEGGEGVTVGSERSRWPGRRDHDERTAHVTDGANGMGRNGHERMGSVGRERLQLTVATVPSVDTLRDSPSPDLRRPARESARWQEESRGRCRRQ